MSIRQKVRVGIIGIGHIGRFHAKYLTNGEILNAELVAVSDVNSEALKLVKRSLRKNIRIYDNNNDLFTDKELDSVLISTRHYEHPSLAIKAFQNNLHVMIEKPAGVYTKQVKEMNEVAKKSNKVFSIMFCLRAKSIFQKVYKLVKSGEIGNLKRISWIATSSYRPQIYYDSSSWRATWVGEGGGVLLNQASHQLDLLQWICGMPKRIRAFCSFGKYHDIEVEDEVTAYMEYENGASGVFISSTGEAPGSDRFEIIGDRGKIIVEEGELKYWHLCVSEREFNQKSNNSFDKPECWECKVPLKDSSDNIHLEITKNWINSILKGSSLIAPGEEGINMVQLANGMYLSAWTDSWIKLPIDDDLFYEELQSRIKSSSFKKRKSKFSYLEAKKSF